MFAPMRPSPTIPSCVGECVFIIIRRVSLMLPGPLIEGASCYNHGKFSSPSPREERAGRGMGRGVSRRMGLLSPTLSSCWGGEGADLLRPLGGGNKMRPLIGQFDF